MRYSEKFSLRSKRSKAKWLKVVLNSRTNGTISLLIRKHSWHQVPTWQCSCPCSCRASTAIAAPSGEWVCIFYKLATTMAIFTLWRFLTSGDLDLWPFQLKIDNPLTRALGNVDTNYYFSTFFLFSSFKMPVRDRRTDRLMDGKTPNAAYTTAA